MERRDTTIRPYKIMIVDDDPLVIKTLEKLLFKKNYLFFSVTSGEEALEVVEEIQPDMILLDVFMKGMNGFDVCTALKQMGITRKIPVIFLTSNDQTKDILVGFQAGAVDYVLKPFHSEELLIRVQTHLELRKAREEIKTMTLSQSRFYSIITHDIKDSLTGVKGVAEFLNDELANDPVDINELKKLTSLLLTDTKDLYNFLNSLITCNEIETDNSILSITDLYPEELFDEVIDNNLDLLEAKNINITKNISNTGLILTDKSYLLRIINELVKNAVKYSYEGESITLSYEKDNNKNVISVEDAGVGMDKNAAENLLKIDTIQPKTIGTKKEKGVGLGLIICQSMIKKLKGKIILESEKNKGSTFTLELPDLE